MFSHFFILSSYTCHMGNLIVSVHCIVCILVFFVSVMFPFSNIDVPINCFPEVIKPTPLLLASIVDSLHENKIMFQRHS